MNMTEILNESRGTDEEEILRIVNGPVICLTSFCKILGQSSSCLGREIVNAGTLADRKLPLKCLGLMSAQISD